MMLLLSIVMILKRFVHFFLNHTSSDKFLSFLDLNTKLVNNILFVSLYHKVRFWFKNYNLNWYTWISVQLLVSQIGGIKRMYYDLDSLDMTFFFVFLLKSAKTIVVVWMRELLSTIVFRRVRWFFRLWLFRIL